MHLGPSWNMPQGVDIANFASYHGEGEKVFCDTLTLRMYERTLPIRATCELVQKQGTLVTLSR